GYRRRVRWRSTTVAAAVALAVMTACDNGQSDGRGQGRDAERPTVVALGDSLTTPVGSGSDQDWWQAADPSGQVDLIATGGGGGQRTDEILARVERDVIAHDPDW